MHEFFAHPVVKGAIAGAISGASVDFAAFRAWKNAHDFVSYDWGTAAFRWAQGAFFGVMTAIGLGAAGL
jgi:hypothetical protein